MSAVAIFSTNSLATAAQELNFSYPPDMGSAEAHVYKTVDNVDLQVWIFTPPDHRSTDKRPAVVFFYGGGFRIGTPEQFRKHCEYFSGRGMVAFAVDYRVSSRHQTGPDASLLDAKSAMRWVRMHAEDLGVDATRIAAAGGSAGGLLAVGTATILDMNSALDDTTISASPNALLLLNPNVILAPVPGIVSEALTRELDELQERYPFPLEPFSPYHHIQQEMCPTLIMHGIADTQVPFVSVELFTKKMRELGNRCDLYGYPGAGHGFFNYGLYENTYYTDTLLKMDAFLVSLGYLTPLPETKDY
ncbi:MAG: alpha/beta hydrolase fold domain-containing protein [Candidatus Marinimicrobia bacterium]|nr:alpha/beta hydrolase fold domain-containing protein [Candidatus Neomarinimicrobiota bacterium]